MSKLRTVTLVLGPIFVLGTMAIGLRLGAEAPGTAAHLIAFPPPLGSDRLVWQVRLFREERRIREPAPNQPFSITARLMLRREEGRETTRSGVTNVEGIAEVELPLVARPGDPVHVEITGGGVVLARGEVRVPERAFSRAPEPLKATKTSGGGVIEVFAPPGGIAPSVDEVVRVRVHGEGGASASNLRVKAEGEAGLEVTGALLPPCPAGWTSIPVRAMGHVLALHVTSSADDSAATTATWFGALPVILGGDEVTVDPVAPQAGAPFAVRVKSPTSKPLVYVEVFDEGGRAAAAPVPLERVAGYGQAALKVAGLPAGRHFAIVSSRAEGFGLGTAVARPFVIGSGPPASCETDAELALRQPPPVARPVALDGFTLRREEAARTRKKGMTLAISSLAVGGIMAALLLLAPLRKPREASLEQIAGGTTPRWLVAAMLLGLCCLAYFLLAGMVLFSGD